MRKIAVILLLLCYGTASMGATIHLHYCMGKYVGWDLWHGKKDKKCGKCGMKEKKGGCCKDEHKQIKLNDDHQKSAAAQYLQLLEAPALVTPLADFNCKPVSAPLTFPLPHAPPLLPTESLYILNCVFLI